jgi:hypothetical protein
MDRLRLIVKDYSLLGGSGFRMWWTIWSIFRCTVYRCPYCRWVFKVTWGPFNSLLGTGERACSRCKQVFWDSSSEWPEMSSDERFSFLVPITVAGYLGVIIVIGALVVYAHLYFKNATTHVDLIFVVLLVLPIAAWFSFRTIQVMRSIRRYNDRGKTSPS